MGGFLDVIKVVPNSPFVIPQDVFNYNKCSVDQSALGSNLIVVFSI